MPGHVVILALLSAINPTMLTAVAIMLGRPRPAGNLAAFLGGGMLISIAFGVAALTILHGVNLGKEDSVHLSQTVEVVVGSMSLIAALLFPRALPHVEHRAELHKERKAAKHHDREGPSRLERMLEKASMPMSFVIGVAFNMPGACYLVSIAELAEQAPPTAVWLPAILLFNVIMFLPCEIPLALYLRDPDSVMQRVDATRTWLRHHAVQLARIMFVVVGLYLYARALMGH